MKNLEFLEANLEALKARCPYTFDWLNEVSIDLTAVSRAVVRQPNGVLDWRISPERSLFERIPPDRVYENWTFEGCDAGSVVILIGCNLGYGMHHILQRAPDTLKLVVLEPRREMVMACLGQTDYRNLFREKRLFFIPPKPDFLRKAAFCLDLHYVFGRIDIFCDLPSQQLGPEYARWSQRWKGVLEDLICDVKTLRRGQDVMVENELKNFARAMEDGTLLSLKGMGAGVTAVLLGAGPSLARFGPRLAAHRGSVFYGCGLQTLPAMQRLGLKPHLCMAIDYTAAMQRTYEALDSSWAADIPLIYSCKVQPEVVQAYPGPTLPLWTAGGLGTHMSPRRELVMPSGKGVGVTLSRFLMWCGVDRLVLVGHDFSWPANKTHAEGHFSHHRNFRFDPKRHETCVNADGETVYSSLAYLTALRELERDLEGTTPPVFNLNGGGMPIKGSRSVSWREVCEANLLDSDGGAMERFCQLLDQARAPRPWPKLEAKATSWSRSLRFAGRRLGGLFKRPGRNQREVHEVLNQILVFLRQDPLYQPYLYNEIMDLAGLVHGRRHYGRKEWTECRSIIRKVVKKIHKVDDHLIPHPAPTAP